MPSDEQPLSERLRGFMLDWCGAQQAAEAEELADEVAELEAENERLWEQREAANEMLTLAANNTAAADLAQEVEHLKAENERLRHTIRRAGCELERADD